MIGELYIRKFEDGKVDKLDNIAYHTHQTKKLGKISDELNSYINEFDMFVKDWNFKHSSGIFDMANHILFSEPQYYQLIHFHLMDKLEELKDKKIYEFGFGCGSYLHVLDQMGANVSGCDMRDCNIKFINEYFDLDVHYNQAVNDLIKRDEKFDAIVSMNTMMADTVDYQECKDIIDECAKRTDLIINSGITSVYTGELYEREGWKVTEYYYYIEKTIVMEKIK
ncbi:class I SAM-dependent methyltransferase [Nanoarchaeota archaeon]